MQRRAFLTHAAGAAAMLAAGPLVAQQRETQAMNISLAQWSLNRRFFSERAARQVSQIFFVC